MIQISEIDAFLNCEGILKKIFPNPKKNPVKVYTLYLFEIFLRKRENFIFLGKGVTFNIRDRPRNV